MASLGGTGVSRQTAGSVDSQSVIGGKQLLKIHLLGTAKGSDDVQGGLEICGPHHPHGSVPNAVERRRKTMQDNPPSRLAL